MENIKRKNKILSKNILSIILAVLFSFSFFAVSTNCTNVNASTTTEYTDVLEDLSIDENFNVDDYPAISPTESNDYTLQVIQIAESSDSELFIYVYQPEATTYFYTASTINISQSIGDNLSYVNYELTLLNSNGVFFKYKVEGITLKTDVLRYYDISSIYRYFDEEIDEDTGNTNEITEIAYEVAQQWTVTTLNDVVYYNCYETDVVTITDKYVANIRLSSGYDAVKLAFLKTTSACDLHAVIFSCDHDIDTLIEAEVSYVSQSKTVYDTYTSNNKTGSEVSNQVILSYDEEVTYESGVFVKTTYTWNRIMTTSDFSDFINNDEYVTKINDDSDLTNALDTMDWVLCFDETTYSKNTVIIGSSLMAGGNFEDIVTTYTDVSEVTILRLTFTYDGVVYNLGCVDNKTTGTIIDGTVSGETDWSELFESIWTYLKYILLAIAVLAVVVLLSVFTPFLRLLMELVIKGITYIFKAIWWIISSPFKFLYDLIKGGE